MSRVIDLTLPVETGMPTCGTPWHQKVSIERMGKISEVGRNTSKIILGSHSGTHMDAPLHFIEGGNDIKSLNLDYLCGAVTVVDLSRYGQGDVVPLSAVEHVKVTERMLFRFLWYKNWKTSRYYDKFPYFSGEAIDFLIDNGMKVIALDTPSPDDGGAITDLSNDSPNHKKMLRKGIIIVEYLNNTEVLDASKKYEIIALPLKLVGSDGSPSRVIARDI